jgi:predicted nucleic acid-binding protein
MAQKTVIDTSVIVKWLNTDNEDHLDKADRILKDAHGGKVELIAPELAKYEVGNVLLFGKKLSKSQVQTPLHWLFKLPIKFVSQSEELSSNTFSIAADNKITYYDAAFVALAKSEQANLITDNIKHQGRVSGIKVVKLEDY